MTYKNTQFGPVERRTGEKEKLFQNDMTAKVVAERLVLIVSQIDQFIKGFDRYGFPKEDEQKLKDARFALLRLYLSRYQIKDVDIIDDEDVVVKQMLKNGSNYRKDLKRNRHRDEE